MTVRFKCQSEYQKSYHIPRSRSVSPQRCLSLAGLCSDQLGISREPGLQRRRKVGPGGLAPSHTSLLRTSDPRCNSAQQTTNAQRKVSSAATGSRSANRTQPSLDPKPPTSPETRVEPESPAAPQTPAGPRPAGDPEPVEMPQHASTSSPTAEPGTAGKSTKPHLSQANSQPQPSHPLTSAPDGQQPSANEVEHALRWKAGLRPGGQRLGGQRSEYHRQYSGKKPATSASPILTAEQVLYSSNRSVPPFKKNPVSMETEYKRNFQGLAPPSGPRLRTHLEHQRIPLFQMYTTNKKRRQGSPKKPHPKDDVPAPHNSDTTPTPPVQRGHRMLTEYESSFRSPLYRIPEQGGATDGHAPQVAELRQKALAYRRRAWGTNFSRDHLSQLQSDHNCLWEPADTTDSPTDLPSPRLTSDLGQESGSRSPACVEALDLASLSSHSSKRLSVVGSGEIHKNTQIEAQTAQSPPAERRTAWEEEKEEENTDEEEGRLPTPKLRMRPVQRTHHDLTTPAAGGAILVGTLKSGDESSPIKPQRCASAVSMAAGMDRTPTRQTEAWSEKTHPHSHSNGPSPDHKSASKSIRMKQMPPSPVAPCPLVSPPLHGIQGTLRHADFQHNGELGVRFRELQCSGGGCGLDEDDRLSVMSWHSAASCSVASAILERAQKRRDNFWGKR